MTTQEYIENQLHITMQQAKDFFLAFLLTHPREVYDICLSLGINNDMIADILSIEGITGQIVSGFFTLYEKDGDALGFNINNTLNNNESPDSGNKNINNEENSNQSEPLTREELDTLIQNYRENPTDENAELIINANTSEITDMSYLFVIVGNDIYERHTFNLDISGWDVSNVTNMEAMFLEARNFNQNLSSWNTSNVTNMANMFSSATSFNQDISQWDTSNVIRMDGMFMNALTFNQDISSWDTSLVYTMNSMFGFSRNFNQDISSWNTSNVIYTAAMFDNASSFNQDISSWDTSSVTDMRNMFQSADSFDQDISNWEVSNVTSYDNFNNAADLLNDHEIPHFGEASSDDNDQNETNTDYLICTEGTTTFNETNLASIDAPGSGHGLLANDELVDFTTNTLILTGSLNNESDMVDRFTFISPCDGTLTMTSTYTIDYDFKSDGFAGISAIVAHYLGNIYVKDDGNGGGNHVTTLSITENWGETYPTLLTSTYQYENLIEGEYYDLNINFMGNWDDGIFNGQYSQLYNDSFNVNYTLELYIA